MNEIEIKRPQQKNNMYKFMNLIDWIVENNNNIDFGFWSMDRKVKGKDQRFMCDLTKGEQYKVLFKIKIILKHDN